MGKLLDGLLSYFENNTQEQILKDWEAAEKWDDVGPKIDDFLEQLSNEIVYKPDISTANTEISNNTPSPKFSSDFFLSSYF